MRGATRQVLRSRAGGTMIMVPAILVPAVLVIAGIFALILYLDKRDPVVSETPRRNQANAADRAANSLARATWVIAFLTLAIFIAGVAQYVTFKKQLTVMQGQLDAEQEPVIWVGNNLGTPNIVPNPTHGSEQIDWTVHYTNVGKGLVSNGKYQSFVGLGDGAFEQTYGQIGWNPMSPVATNEDQFITVISSPKNQGLLGDFARTERGIRVLIHFIYFGISGKQHDAVICLTKLLTGAIQFCPGSYIK